MKTVLHAQELLILKQFADDRDHGCVELAEKLKLPAWQVRAAAQLFRRNGLIRRSPGADGIGKHHLTDLGRRQLAEQRQLRLIT